MDSKSIIFEVINSLNKEKAKRTRDTFTYLEPKGDKSKFAQCSTCRFWTTKTCLILGKTEISGDMSCNFYTHGKPSADNIGKEQDNFTPKEAGLVKRQVRCENCISFDEKTSKCMFFQKLNESLSDLFNLEEKVNPQGCCNAQKPKK